jgi:hypothetical protein
MFHVVSIKTRSAVTKRTRRILIHPFSRRAFLYTLHLLTAAKDGKREQFFHSGSEALARSLCRRGMGSAGRAIVWRKSGRASERVSATQTIKAAYSTPEQAEWEHEKVHTGKIKKKMIKSFVSVILDTARKVFP